MDTRSDYNENISIHYNSKQSCLSYLYLGKPVTLKPILFSYKNSIIYDIYIQQ